MKVKILGLDGKEKGEKQLPNHFSEAVRQDLIKRAVEAIQANRRQPYGAHPEAGKRQKGKLSRRRHNYKTSYGIGISRVPRKIMSHRGSRFNWVGAVAPGTVGGRRAHPPKAQKIWSKKINLKEKRKAIRSALAASLNKKLVEQRGHKVPENFPFIVDSALEEVQKTKELQEVFKALGLDKDLQRTKKTKNRAGVAALRGRKTRRAKGPLVVVSKECAALKTARNIPGVDVVTIDKVNCELLAPGADVGRLTLYTEGAVDALENLFVEVKK
ncbi:50S ribosomal protein L4 [Candidatus Woesearchaeota archaeon]|jgi:large subunit ribosomal protein L4e|nr:MAG: 50S ribosomal protein L4 [Candidatus Woesearchaeota archaeon]